MMGKLYGVGVGPGDPELVTVKAAKLISSAQAIAYLSANGGVSLARSIAESYFSGTAPEISIDMPMRVEREPAAAAYDEGCARIADHLKHGRDVVFLCEGDPFFYGSFMYVFERLALQFETIVVPGVTSISASAAATGKPLVARDEVLKILPATLNRETLLEALSDVSSAAIIKVGRHFQKVKTALAQLDLVGSATAIAYASQEKQTIRAVADIHENSLPYFTTIIVRRSA